MARLSISDSGPDTVWTLSANWDDQYNTSSPFVFSLNYRMPTGSISQPALSLFDVVGSIGVRSFDNTGIYFQPSNGPDRFTDGESASWKFLNTAPDQFTDFELHINAIYDGGSVKFTDYTVPEPSTYGLLAFLVRDRFRKLRDPAETTLLDLLLDCPCGGNSGGLP